VSEASEERRRARRVLLRARRQLFIAAIEFGRATTATDLLALPRPPEVAAAEWAIELAAVDYATFMDGWERRAFDDEDSRGGEL
jgi:hypothetical protein